MILANFIIEGGVNFTIPLTLMGLAMAAFIIRGVMLLMNDSELPSITKNNEIVKQLATLSLVWGILGQLTGLFQAFDAISKMENVSSAVLAGGLKVSLICTLYGVAIFVIGRLALLALTLLNKKK
ncbi:MotA/TolQ/ExbB proton channel family protein [Fulvivirga maritima]|uniref:MotA/TolQ/ExbB proton channel family protein n=1 Tax=Fulvivirga maritima TaxID=2904247 RepID=UPI001F19B996|nr:MotA/TolQ/ExbB proton channel family protein [Fulvivirga maritima]UII24463.1 MotA/TolQ/ExbB proton channel family protein [Fulvivirga maritima]